MLLNVNPVRRFLFSSPDLDGDVEFRESFSRRPLLSEDSFVRLIPPEWLRQKDFYVTIRDPDHKTQQVRKGQDLQECRGWSHDEEGDGLPFIRSVPSR